MTRPPAARAQRGAALIAVLAVVSFLAIIVVSLSVAMQSESQAAHYYEARTAAEFMAREGVEDVRAALFTAAGKTPTNFWASAPGMLYCSTGTAALLSIPLLSDAWTNGTGVLAAPDLNRRAVTDDGLPVITGPVTGAGAMNAGWIYVHASGRRETGATLSLAASAADPVIGRYAYWADDESSRVNVNTSRGRAGNALSPNHPSQVGLDGLLDAAAIPLVAGGATNNPFATVDQLRLLSAQPGGSSIPGSVSSNRYSLTAASFSPLLDPLGRPRIVLTTQKSLAGSSTNYLNILTTANADPGKLSALNMTAVAATVSNLTVLLTTNVPPFNASFAAKYHAAKPARIAQLALDIVEYVRCAESTNAIVEPLRGNWSANTFNTANTAVSDSFVGTTRHPVIRQVAIWVGSTPLSAGIWVMRAEVGLFLPPGYGLPSASLTNCQLTIQSYANLTPPSGVGTCNNMILPTAAAFLGTGVVSSNGYCVVTGDFTYTNGTIPATYPLRVAISSPAPNPTVFDVAPMAATYVVDVPVTQQASAPAVGDSLRMAVVDDARQNKNASMWTTVTDRLGQLPSSSALPSTNAVPPQDTDSVGNVTAAAMRLPAPKGTPGAPGQVGSVAELGYLPTGVDTSTNGVPYRSLRLQPTPAGKRVLPPDWALLDFFSAPISTNLAAVYLPYSNTVAGRINVNAGLPFTNNPSLARLAPIQALLAAGGGPTNAAAAVAAMTLAVSGTNYGAAVYLSPGELSEVQGVADGGEATEANLLRVVDLATAQGGAFRVYSVGQAVKQTAAPNPTLIVLSEQYREAIVAGRSAAVANGGVLLWKTVAP